MFERILVPTDGSDAMDPVVEYAVDLALESGAALHVVSVVDAVAADMEAPVDLVDGAFERQARDAVDAVRDRAVERGVVDVSTTVARGRAHEEIVACAADRDVDLVVMGTHGRTGLNRYLLGSVAERVVRTAPVPVLTVRVTED
ncbi:MAG: universal stress protein [Halobacteriaceae archaeon]